MFIQLLESRVLFAVIATPLVTFNGTNGETPHTILQDNSGDLIGITRSGGANNFGEIFRVANVSNPQLEILTPFTDGPEGRAPISLAMNANGDIFGTTELGGANNVGTLFKLPRGSSTIEKLLDLSSTPASQSEVATAGARLAPFSDPAGNLYGVITPGTVFRIDAGSSVITQLDFIQGNVNDLTLDPNGNLFGTTFLGGNDGFGSIFEIPANSTTANTIAFFNPAVGTTPNGLIVDSAGNLYGSTQTGGANGMGGVFKVAQGTSTIELLGSFDGANGNQPGGKPALDDHGNLFGITRQGGAGDNGTLYKLTTGSNTILPVYSLGLSEGTIPALANDFGDIQQPIVEDVNSSLDPDGWHFNYPPPPPGNPETAIADIPADDNIRLGLPVGGPSVTSSAAREFRPPASASFGVTYGAIVYFSVEVAISSWALNVSVTGNVPANAVAGGAMRLPVKVNIRNDSDQAMSKTPATVRLLLSADGQVAGATEIASTTKKLSIKPDQSKAVALRVTSIPSLAQGSYQVIAQVVDPTNANNAATGSGPSIAIAPPFVSAAISSFNPTKSTATIGKKAAFSLILTNNGNVSATGTANVTASIATDPTGAGGTPVTVKPLKVKLKPASQRTFKLSVALPADLAPGAYFVSLNLDVAAIGDTDPSHGVVVSTSPLTIS